MVAMCAGCGCGDGGPWQACGNVNVHRSAGSAAAAEAAAAMLASGVSGVRGLTGFEVTAKLFPKTPDLLLCINTCI